MGQAVVTSLGLPRWREEAANWPRCWLITPTWALFRETDEQAFVRGYVGRLERFGSAKISRALHQIARERQADRLVLLCHETDWEKCHRQLFARWLTETAGDVVEELS